MGVNNLVPSVSLAEQIVVHAIVVIKFGSSCEPPETSICAIVVI